MRVRHMTRTDQVHATSLFLAAPELGFCMRPEPAFVRIASTSGARTQDDHTRTSRSCCRSGAWALAPAYYVTFARTRAQVDEGAPMRWL